MLLKRCARAVVRTGTEKSCLFRAATGTSTPARAMRRPFQAPAAATTIPEISSPPSLTPVMRPWRSRLNPVTAAR